MLLLFMSDATHALPRDTRERTAQQLQMIRRRNAECRNKQSGKPNASDNVQQQLKRSVLAGVTCSAWRVRPCSAVVKCGLVCVGNLNQTGIE